MLGFLFQNAFYNWLAPINCYFNKLNIINQKEIYNFITGFSLPDSGVAWLANITTEIAGVRIQTRTYSP